MSAQLVYIAERPSSCPVPGPLLHSVALTLDFLLSKMVYVQY